MKNIVSCTDKEHINSIVFISMYYKLDASSNKCPTKYPDRTQGTTLKKSRSRRGREYFTKKRDIPLCQRSIPGFSIGILRYLA